MEITPDNRTDSFFEAIKQGDLQSIEVLLAQDPNLVKFHDANGNSAVLTAAYYQQPAVLTCLITHNAPLNLFEACAAGQIDAARVILDQQPEQVNAWASDGFQPLGLACFFGHTAIVDLLLTRGAEVNSPSRNGLRVQPLNSAVAGQHLDIARLLLDHGADPNARQGEDFAPLHGAAQNGQVEMIQLLLAHGADPHLNNMDGKTPHDYAVENGHTQAAELLR